MGTATAGSMPEPKVCQEVMTATLAAVDAPPMQPRVSAGQGAAKEWEHASPQTPAPAMQAATALTAALSLSIATPSSGKSDDSNKSDAGSPYSPSGGDDSRFAFLMKRKAEMEAKLLMIEQRLSGVPNGIPQPRPPPGGPTPHRTLAAMRTSASGGGAGGSPLASRSAPGDK